MLEVVKNLINILQAFLPLLDSNLQLLPVNPKVRSDVGVTSIIVALVAGLVAYYFAKSIKKRSRYVPGVGGFVVFVVALAGILFFGNDVSLGIPISYLPAVIRCAYVAVFCGVGLAVGGSLGLT